jgi:zinc and cadmium transporter
LINLFYITLLVVPVFIAGATMFFLKLSESRLKVLLAFSAAYLLALSFLHLIPELFAEKNGTNAGLWIMGGFFIQVSMEFFSKGIEHGHAHIHSQDHKLPVALLSGLYLHSFIEGLPLAGIFDAEPPERLFSFIAGVTLHNIPIALAFTGLLLHEHIHKSKVVFYLLLFTIMAPLGALLGKQLQRSFTDVTTLTAVFTAIVIGIFLHVSTTIIFESSEKNHRYHISKLIAIIAGACLAYGLTTQH